MMKNIFAISSIGATQIACTGWACYTVDNKAQQGCWAGYE
jgi:hypothetical protein